MATFGMLDSAPDAVKETEDKTMFVSDNVLYSSLFSDVGFVTGISITELSLSANAVEDSSETSKTNVQQMLRKPQPTFLKPIACLSIIIYQQPITYI
ncbi:hypothetical protein J7W08_06055 [Methanococcoides orientis]|uniref:hypothetical protein n=1 Tax=Methanococcoides orientis TaxID=2822137 RepID=UPI001E377C50|nr:hypothetical protein [Methanococcoides orientis]UGV39706.1 hypothetical protein J7W08_06055 [Methanococcoides orientis]